MRSGPAERTREAGLNCARPYFLGCGTIRIRKNACWRNWSVRDLEGGSNSSGAGARCPRDSRRDAGATLALLFDSVPVEHLLGVVVLNLRAVAQHLIVSGLEQLFAAIVELRADRLLHAGIRQLALASRLFGNQLDDAEAQSLPGLGIYNADDRAILAGLKLCHGIAGRRIGPFQT